MEIIDAEKIKHSLQHGHYSVSVLREIKGIVEQKYKQTCPALDGLFELFCCAIQTPKEEVLDRPKDTTASRNKHLFVALVLKIYSPDYIVCDDSRPAVGTLVELVKVLQISPSWLSDMVKNARTYYLIYSDFRAKVDTILKKTSEVAPKSSEVSR